MSETLATSFGKEFDKLRGKYATSPEGVEEYERTVHSLVAVRELLMSIDSERRHAGLSKAELARRIHADPSVIRRLFSSSGSNPTFKTILDILWALDVEIVFSPRRGADSPIKEIGAARAKPRQKMARTGTR